MCLEQEKKCMCLPYKDGVLITAQALSIVAILISFASWTSIFFGLPAFIMLQCVWCCKMNKCGMITAGVFSCIAALGDIGLAIAFFALSCSSYSYYDDDYFCNVGTGAGVVALVAGLCWLGCAVCTFIFSCGKRMEKFINGNENGAPPNNTTKNSVEVDSGGASPAMASATAVPTVGGTTTITHLPDGTIKEEIEVVNPDGSKTITVHIKNAPNQENIYPDVEMK